ncbi:MAG: hypothetical protein PVF58_20480 [Candidatus Methanofastidiosia archaeon]
MDNVVLLGFTLGILSGLSPTLMGVYTDIVSEVARTTRKEMDVVFRSLIFCTGMLLITFGVFIGLESTLFLHFLGILLGFAVALNLFNTGLHTFNSYTRVDNYIKAKFIYLDSFSVLKLGVIHGVGKFPDSVPFFIPFLCVTIMNASFVQGLFWVILFSAGIVTSFVIVLLLAILQYNIFRKFESQIVNQIYFCAAGGVTIMCTVWLFWELLDKITAHIAFILILLVIMVSGVLIGYKRRIVY